MWNRRSVSGLSSRLENRTVIILLETSDTRTSPQSPVVDTGTWLRIIFPPVTDKNISRNAASRSNRSRYCRSSYESPGHRFDLPSPASAFFFFFFFPPIFPPYHDERLNRHHHFSSTWNYPPASLTNVESLLSRRRDGRGPFVFRHDREKDLGRNVDSRHDTVYSTLESRSS